MFVREFNGSIEAYAQEVARIAGQHPAWSAAWSSAAPEGFPVRLSASRGQLFGDFGGLETEFFDLGTALLWAKRAGSPQWQLRIVLAGGKPRTWLLEASNGKAAASPRLAVGHVGLFDRFRKSSIVVRRNSTSP